MLGKCHTCPRSIEIGAKEFFVDGLLIFTQTWQSYIRVLAIANLSDDDDDEIAYFTVRWKTREKLSVCNIRAPY